MSSASAAAVRVVVLVVLVSGSVGFLMGRLTQFVGLPPWANIIMIVPGVAFGRWVGKSFMKLLRDSERP